MQLVMASLYLISLTTPRTPFNLMWVNFENYLWIVGWYLLTLCFLGIRSSNLRSYFWAFLFNHWFFCLQFFVSFTWFSHSTCPQSCLCLVIVPSFLLKFWCFIILFLYFCICLLILICYGTVSEDFRFIGFLGLVCGFSQIFFVCSLFSNVL